MATKIAMSEKEFKEKVGKQCEDEFARLSNDLFNKITTKYEDMIKEQTKSEIDKVNDEIKKQCPVSGALVLHLDKSEVTIPFNPLSKVYITGYVEGGDNKTLEFDYEALNNEDNLLNIYSFAKMHKFIKIKTVVGREVELYDKDAFENEGKVIKNMMNYSTTYVTALYPEQITSIYLVNADLK